MPVRFIRRAGNPPENTVVLRQFGWMYRILGSWTKRREHTRIGLVPWNILPSFMFTSAIWIMRYMSLAYRRRWLRQPKGRRKRKIGYVGFIGFFVSVFDSVFFLFETASPQMRVHFITEVIWIVINIQQKVIVAVSNLAPSTLPTILHQNRVGRVLGMRFGRYLAITSFIYNAVTTKDPNYRVIARLHCTSMRFLTGIQ